MDATRVGPSRGRLIRARSGLVLPGRLAAAPCAINPATDRNQLPVVREEQGIAMGRQAHTAIVATIGLRPDAARRSCIDGSASLRPETGSGIHTPFAEPPLTR